MPVTRWPAADILLTDENARRYGAEWLAAANSASGLYWLARGPQRQAALLERVEVVAAQLGDDYHLAQAQLRQGTHAATSAVRDMARDRGDHFLEAEMTIDLASDLADDEPAAAAPLLLEAQTLAATSGNRDLRNDAQKAHADAAASTGDLRASIELATGILTRASSASWAGAVRVLGFSALLARDEQALRLAVEVGDRALRVSPGPATVGAQRSAPSRTAPRSTERRRPPLARPQLGPAAAGEQRDAMAVGSRSGRRRRTRTSQSTASERSRDPSRTPRLSSPRSKPPRPVTATAGTTHSPSPSTKASGSSPSTRSKASPSAPPRSGTGPNRCCSSAPRSVSATKPATNGASRSSNAP